MTRDPKRLLGGYATDSLTEEERAELLRAALDDQELFDAVLENEGLRELLESPGARNEVLAALERPTAWERARAWLGRPATFGHLATAVAVLVVAVVGYRVFQAEAPDSRIAAARRQAEASTLPDATIQRLSTLPPREAIPASLEITAATGHPRSPTSRQWNCKLSVRAPARVHLLLTEPDGTVAQLLPAMWGFRNLLEPPPGGGRAVRELNLALPDRPDPGTLRLVVTQADVNLAEALPADVERLAERMTIIDRAFEVTEP